METLIHWNVSLKQHLIQAPTAGAPVRRKFVLSSWAGELLGTRMELDGRVIYPRLVGIDPFSIKPQDCEGGCLARRRWFWTEQSFPILKARMAINRTSLVSLSILWFGLKIFHSEELPLDTD